MPAVIVMLRHAVSVGPRKSGEPRRRCARRPEGDVVVGRVDVADAQVAVLLGVEDPAVREHVDPARVVGRRQTWLSSQPNMFARRKASTSLKTVNGMIVRRPCCRRRPWQSTMLLPALTSVNVYALSGSSGWCRRRGGRRRRVGDDDRVGPEMVQVRVRRIRRGPGGGYRARPRACAGGSQVGAEHAVVDREVDVAAGVDRPERRRERAGRDLAQDRGDVEDEIEPTSACSAIGALVRAGVVGVLAPDELDAIGARDGVSSPGGAASASITRMFVRTTLPGLSGPKRMLPLSFRSVVVPIGLSIVPSRTTSFVSGATTARGGCSDRDQRRRERVLDVEFERRAGRRVVAARRRPAASWSGPGCSRR